MAQFFFVCFLNVQVFFFMAEEKGYQKQNCEIPITVANAADAEREQMCWAKAWEVVLESQEPG